MPRQIFEISKIGDMLLKNRLVRSATWEGLAAADGSFDVSMIRVYEELAAGGTGLIITGFTSVDSNDRYFGGMMRLSEERHIEPMRQLVDTVHHYDVPVVAQLALGAYYKPIDDNRGMSGENDEESISSGRFREIAVDNLTVKDIHHIRNLFIDAAKRAFEAGYDGVQIHEAHNFFLSRFVSPLYNHRQDAYGGNAENRARLVIEILDGIKKQVPNLAVLIKINGSDMHPQGVHREDVQTLARLFEKHGGDAIEVSANGTSVPGIMPGVNEGYFLPLADIIREVTTIPLIAVGGFRTMPVMTEAIETKRVDYIALSRPLIREPDLPSQWKNDPSYVATCISCNACYRTEGHRCIYKNIEGSQSA